MCGFAGLLDPGGGRSAADLDAIAASMARTLLHRGPDDGGTWSDPAAGVALGSRRLAIIDLSAEGHQPMVSASGRLVLAYNGEIYNFEEIRQRLEGLHISFRGASDTEVLLAALEAWGVERALSALNGMFAFALWDRRDRTLQLARDRLGEKPLYYGWHDGSLLFGSELKALRAVPGFRPAVDRGTLGRYFRLSRVPLPDSIYEGVCQLEPGSLLTVTPENVASRSTTTKRYWSAFEVAQAGRAEPLQGSPQQVVDALEALLSEAVSLRLRADVPVGVFLSGGVDSSTVAALVARHSPDAVRTFTIGFDDPSYDESGHAAAVARHLATQHTCYRLTAADALAVIPKLPLIYDEPFADTSQIPTYLVSQVAREQVAVALSGDGGDELFGGYNRHIHSGRIHSLTRRVPRPLRTAAARALTALSPAAWDTIFARAGAVLPRSARVRLPGLEIHKLARILPADRPAQLYAALAATWQDPARLVTGFAEHGGDGLPGQVPPGIADLGSQMMYLDLVSYLPDDILVKLDRASMAVSLESRVPLLDHRVVELAWRVPPSLKIRNGSGKWILRELLGRHVPRELVDRPKAGFGLPIGSWLRGALRGWAGDLLDRDRIASQGYLVPDCVEQCWREHLSGRRDRTDELWSILMFQSWLDTYPR